MSSLKYASVSQSRLHSSRDRERSLFLLLMDARVSIWKDEFFPYAIIVFFACVIGKMQIVGGQIWENVCDHHLALECLEPKKSSFPQSNTFLSNSSTVL